MPVLFFWIGTKQFLTSMTDQEKYDQLSKVFEELLTQHIVLAELRDFYRQRAGLKNPTV